MGVCHACCGELGRVLYCPGKRSEPVMCSRHHVVDSWTREKPINFPPNTFARSRTEDLIFLSFLNKYAFKRYAQIYVFSSAAFNDKITDSKTEVISACVYIVQISHYTHFSWTFRREAV